MIRLLSGQFFYSVIRGVKNERTDTRGPKLMSPYRTKARGTADQRPSFVTGRTGKYYAIVMTLKLIVVQCQGFSGGVLMFAEKIFVDL